MAAHRIIGLPRLLRCRQSHRLVRHQYTAAEEVPLFDKLLVANRGEIACRVMRTARRLGVRTVAVYSEADRNSMHTAMADEAYCIGPPPSSESYLRQDKIMQIAKRTGAQAIHPGYGFLSENKHFAELCKTEGVEFVGPPPSAIEKMGIKRVSKAIMSESSVPVVPGYFGEDQSDQRLKEEAEKLGYPVMLKADLGGGGKGMRIVMSSDEFQQALDACRSEAKKSFGDDKMMVEKFVDRPRHVEVQVFGDKHGNTVHLFERDCSVQRRHQKIIEEAPAPGLLAEVREQICLAAVRAAEAVGYVGAGTVEFIMDANQKFYFMEMNTRLQVEHPITEMITGTDLVEWQLRVASGSPLPVSQVDITPNGHAFEARIYAENPDMGFIPSPGHLHHLVTPRPSSSIRIDTGVKQGDDVTSYYDPLIAKLVVWAEDRTTALKKLRDSLLNYQVAGVATNVGFLKSLASHSSFQDGDVHTGFIEQHNDELFPPPQPLSELQRMEAVLALLALEQRSAATSQSYNNDPFSPFNESGGTRVNVGLRRNVRLNHDNQGFEVMVEYNDISQYTLRAVTEDGKLGPPVHANCRLEEEGVGPDGSLVMTGFLEEKRVVANVTAVGDTVYLFTNAGAIAVSVPQPQFLQSREKEEDGGTRSPKYPSTVTKVLVKPGDTVTKGQLLMTVEGMKMETNILAVKDGVVKSVFYEEKSNVPAYSKVVEFEDS